MNRKLLAVLATMILVLAFAGCGGGGGGGDASTQPLGAYTLTGKVTTGTATGAGIAGVTLTMDSNTVSTTDSSGTYTTSCNNGSHTIVPSKTGYTFVPANLTFTINGAGQVSKNFVATQVSGGTSGVCIEVLKLVYGGTLQTCYAGQYTQAECNLFITTDLTVIWHDGATSCQPYGFTLGDCWGDTSFKNCIK
jgi:hypothetical protein